MQSLGTFQQKNIVYTQHVQELAAYQGKNWLALLLTPAFAAKKQGAALAHTIAQDPLFVLCCSSNATDMEDAVVDLLCEKYPGFNDDTVMPMTYGESDLKEALHFALNDAFHEEKEIEEIVVIDLGEPFIEIQTLEKLLESFRH